MAAAMFGAVQPSAAAVTTAALAGLTPKSVSESGTRLVGHAPESQHLRLVFGLTPKKLAEQEQLLQDLQTKGSAHYQQFLTAEEWNVRFSPSAADEQAVVEWAQSQGLTVTHRFANRLLVDVDGAVPAVERALGVTINRYELTGASGATTSFYSNDRDPQVPTHLSGVLHSIGGLNDVQRLVPANKASVQPAYASYVAGPVHADGPVGGANADGSRLPSKLAKDALDASKSSTPARAATVSPSITGGSYDPSDLFSSNAYDANALYAQGHCCNPLHAAGSTPPETSIAIATAGTQNASDYAGFQARYSYLAYHYQTYYIDGTPACCDGEGTMDFEWSTAMANSFGSYVDTALVYMYDGVNANFSTFTDIYNHMLSDSKARVFSTSWGCGEIDCTPASVMDTDHAIFNAMVGQGWTLVAASGDGGATTRISYSDGTTDCVHHDSVSYPASDPNVVAAGGTQLRLYSGPAYGGETTWTGGPGGCVTNDGGSGGGYSAYFATPGYQSGMGFGTRAVPDVALNADFYYTPQNLYFNGSFGGNGGTSIVAPEVAGFFANENAYLLYLSTVTGGLCNGHACAPIGNANYKLYYFGNNPYYAPHYPYYDITTGCNNNNYTAAYGFGYFCATAGNDRTTGWGSFNMLQLGWAINTYQAGDFAGPNITFTGPPVEHWYRTQQTVSWTIADASSDGLPPTGVAGFTQSWDAALTDATRMATPGSGNAFYSGPEFANATGGCLSLTSGSGCGGGVSQGWHTVHVRAWDNTGSSSGDKTYGRVGYDSIAPHTVSALNGTRPTVSVTLSATDNASGVASIVYQLDGGSQQSYSGPFSVTTLGNHTVVFHATDVAGNVETANTTTWDERAATSTAVASSDTSVGYGSTVTFTATAKSTTAGTLAGGIVFRDGSTTLGTVAISGGKASLTTSALHGGSHTITASYGGSTSFEPSTSTGVAETVTQDASKTTLTSSLNPAEHHATVVFTAAVQSTSLGTPAGTVTFKDGSAVLGTGTLSGGGKATYSTTELTNGTHPITAVYAPTSDYTGSTSPTVTETITKAHTTTTLTSSPNPSAYKAGVTFVAKVVSGTFGTPNGTATFKDGSAVLGTVTFVDGKASLTFATLSVGTHTVTVAYGGSSAYLASTSSGLVQTVGHDVTSTSLTSTRNPSLFGNTVTFTASVTSPTVPTVGGTVTFEDGSTVLGTSTLSGGKASYTVSGLSVGSHPIKAVFSQTHNDGASTSSVLTQVVDSATTKATLTASPNPVAAGKAVTFSASVTSTSVASVLGTVTFKEGTTTLGTALLSGGVAKYTTSSLAKGSHTVTAVYADHTGIKGSTSAAVTEKVD